MSDNKPDLTKMMDDVFILHMRDVLSGKCEYNAKMMESIRMRAKELSGGQAAASSHQDFKEAIERVQKVTKASATPIKVTPSGDRKQFSSTYQPYIPGSITIPDPPKKVEPA